MARDAEQTKRRLLDAAIAEFAAYGIAGARVDRIAEQAKANKAMIYSYFGNKEQLFDAAFDLLVNGTVNEVPIDADDLPGYAGRLFDRFWQSPEVVRLSAWHRLERGADGPLHERVAQAHRDKIAAIEAAQADGRLPGHIPAAGLLSLVLVLATMWTPGNPDAASTKFVTTKKARRETVTEAVRQIVRT
ncbi:TetR family transcriptional regulator [Crossiella cryophila]|uniref:AcrR family transcriptional regulator n=1 Tax=Crossiella cryophila TaxID=43355 RepID=A0A7W7CAA9_9PSEU|nr:TetR family transcriptional regulator [Crossiella cryophila]MBB4677470.1 AcrR family transcriptional regulator [Crossiella cryophila]